MIPECQIHIYGQGVNESHAAMLILQYLRARSSDLGHDGSSTGKGRSGKSRHVYPGMSNPDVLVPRDGEELIIFMSNVFPIPVVAVRRCGGKVPLQDANDVSERCRDDRHHRRRSFGGCKLLQSKFILSRTCPSNIGCCTAV